jgi:preprotein translocase subunit SecE
MLNKIISFLADAKLELKRVNWPRREETTRYTLFVVVFTMGLAVFLGFFDFIFLFLLEKFVIR